MITVNVSGNNITVNTTSTVAFGIKLGNGLTSLISQNTISVTTSSTGTPVGISLETGFLSSTVSKNIITKAFTSDLTGEGGRRITVGTASATSALILSNNSIAGVNGSNFTSFSNSSSIGIALGVIGSGTIVKQTNSTRDC